MKASCGGGHQRQHETVVNFVAELVLAQDPQRMHCCLELHHHLRQKRQQGILQQMLIRTNSPTRVDSGCRARVAPEGWGEPIFEAILATVRKTHGTSIAL